MVVPCTTASDVWRSISTKHVSDLYHKTGYEIRGLLQHEYVFPQLESQKICDKYTQSIGWKQQIFDRDKYKK